MNIGKGLVPLSPALIDADEYRGQRFLQDFKEYPNEKYTLDNEVGNIIRLFQPQRFEEVVIKMQNLRRLKITSLTILPLLLLKLGNFGQFTRQLSCQKFHFR